MSKLQISRTYFLLYLNELWGFIYDIVKCRDMKKYKKDLMQRHEETIPAP